MGKKELWKERAKSALIVLLSCSALSLSIWNARILGDKGVQSADPDTTTHGQTAENQVLPAQMALVYPKISGQDPAIFGALYDDDALLLLYQKAMPLLFETLDPSQSALPASSTVWDNLLTNGTCIFLSFLHPIPLSVLSGREEHSQQISQLMFTIEKDQALLYYHQISDNSFFYFSMPRASTSHFDDLFTLYSPNGVLFAFQRDSYQALARYTLLPARAPTAPTYTSGNPLAEEDTLQKTLSVLGFEDPSNSSYPTAEGRVIHNNSDVLRITTQGQLDYSAADGGHSRFPVVPFGNTESSHAAILASVYLAGQLNEKLPHPAPLVVSNVTEENGAYTIEFARMLDGICLFAAGHYPAAKFVIKNGEISKFTFIARSYTQQSDTVELLPTHLALACLPDLTNQLYSLSVGYRANGTTLYPEWVTTPHQP